MTLNRPPAGAKRPVVDGDAELLDPAAEAPIRLAGRTGRGGGTRSEAEVGPAGMKESTSTSPLDVAEQVITERARALGEFIREQRRVARLSLRKLSDMAEISNPYLSQIERGLRKPSAEILQQLARALRISAETLYVQAGILDERHENADLAKAIWDDATLSESQKRALIQVMRSFQAENRAASEAAAAANNK
jgi:transcriptional regulator with XRE-family HTH domain